MFTDEEKRAYHNIKAPDTLYQRITIKSKTPKRMWYGLAAMAASLVLIVTSIVMQGQGDIIVNGRKLKGSVEFYVATAAMERSVSSAVSVPVEPSVKGRTTVLVDGGLVRTEEGEPREEIVIEKSCVLWWEIEPESETQEYKMKISDQKGERILSLKYENSKIIVTKE